MLIWVFFVESLQSLDAFIIQQMSQSSKCNQCFSRFNISRLPHILPCSHNICQLCLKELQKTSQNIVFCEFCQISLPALNLAEIPYNQALQLDIPDQKQIIEISKQQQCFKEEASENLLQCDTPKQQIQYKDICHIHKVSMDIVCINDKIKVCPHCALFGAHKNHIVKRFEDLQKQIAQKCQIFKEIECQKVSNKGLKSQNEILQIVNRKIEFKRRQITKQINAQIQRLGKILDELKHNLENEAKSYLKDVQAYFKKNRTLMRYERSKLRFQKWEKDCYLVTKKLDFNGKIQNVLDLYFNSPLELVSQGYIYLEEVNKNYEQTQNKIVQKIDQFKLLIDTQIPDLLLKSLKFKKAILTPVSSAVKQLNDDISETNPFLDCTSSQIGIQSYIFNQNTSMQAQFPTLTNTQSWKTAQANISTSNIQKRVSSPSKIFSSSKSIEKKDFKTPTMGRFSMKSPKTSQLKASQIRVTKAPETNLKTSQKILKNTSSKQLLPPQTILKPFDPKQPQKMYAQFMKNSLTDFFDLSDCNLSNQKILQYVYLAKKSHKIKGLKLCSNQLTTQGFQRLIQSLKGVCNINLANNKLDENVFQLISKNRQRMDSLRILNLSHNPINIEKKSKNRLEQIKKMGVIVIL